MAAVFMKCSFLCEISSFSMANSFCANNLSVAFYGRILWSRFINAQIPF